ncbi:hypothetical protein N7453_009008 [Penicillium expansum]|nr:hypothetical protein N7453_009008 [Penicillium expansum]
MENEIKRSSEQEHAFDNAEYHIPHSNVKWANITKGANSYASHRMLLTADQLANLKATFATLRYIRDANKEHGKIRCSTNGCDAVEPPSVRDHRRQQADCVPKRAPRGLESGNVVTTGI